MRVFLVALGLVFSASIVEAATITQVSGSVTVKMTATGSPQAATNGMSVPDGAIIITGANGRARVDLGGGRTAMVQPGQQIPVSRLGSSGSQTALNSLGTGLSTNRVAAVAGVRASAVEANTNLWSVELDFEVPGEDEAIAEAESLRAADDTQAAIEVLNTFLTDARRAYRATSMLATLYTEVSDFDSAVPLLEELVDEMPAGMDVARLYWELILCHQSAMNYSESDAVAQRAIARYPSSPELAKIRLVMAQNAFYAGDMNTARERAGVALATAMEQVSALTSGADLAGGVRAGINGQADVQALVQSQMAVWNAARELRSNINATE